MKKQLKILQFPGSLSVGGVGSMLMSIYRNIDKESYHFDFCVVRNNEKKGPYDKEVVENGSVIINVPLIRNEGIFVYLKSLITVLRENGPYDAVHVHSIFNGIYIIIVAKVFGVKKRIYHVHSTNDLSLKKIPFPGLYKYVVSCLIKWFATDYIACGKDAAKYVYGGNFVTKNKAIIINNALDLNVFCAFNNDRIKLIRDELNISKGTLVLGHAGRFIKIKNQKLLIDLVFEMSKRRSVILLFAGEGETRRECEQYAKNLGIENSVKFLGNVSDMPTFYNALDIFILPSLYEGLPVSSIEAQSCGIPCLQADTITKESDMGIGLFYRFNLQDDLKVVIDTCEQIKDERLYDNIVIGASLKNKGYSISETVNALGKIYDNIS